MICSCSCQPWIFDVAVFISSEKYRKIRFQGLACASSSPVCQQIDVNSSCKPGYWNMWNDCESPSPQLLQSTCNSQADALLFNKSPNQPCQQSYLSDGTTSYDFSTLVILLDIIGFVCWFRDDICAKCVAAISPDCDWKNVFVWCVQPLLLPTWKLNAFTCFAAFSWGERIVEVDACCVQLVFGKYDFDHWYFFLRFCKFGIYLLCQYHGEFDRIGFCHFEIWRCGCVDMMTGIGGKGFFFSTLGYRRRITRVSPEIRELLALSCLVLSCRCCCYCCWFCWSCCCCCCCLPSHYRAACATRGTRSSCHWPGDRGGNSLACLRPTVNARHESRAMC